MLKLLTIKNIAIIEELETSFDPGLNILTGETGSGKTVLVQAMKYLLGERFPKDAIRTGADRAVIEGIFESDQSDTVIRRVFSRSGSSRSFINDAPVTLEALRKKSEYLTDIHGQHDQQRLLEPSNHLEYLDAFGDYAECLNEVRDLSIEFSRCENALKDELNQKDHLKQKEELYQFQLTELEQMEYSTGLDEELELEYRLLSNAADIRLRLNQLLKVLDDTDASATGNLGKAMNILGPVTQFDPALSVFEERLSGIRIDTQDLVQEIAAYFGKVTVDDERLADIESQIQHLEMLKRKYGGTLELVAAYHEKISNELKQLNHSDDTITRLKKELDRIKAAYSQSGRKLSRYRKEHAVKFEEKVGLILQELSMAQTVFQIVFTRVPEGSVIETGLETCEFFISTNIGEEKRPLARIASGGELSRIMLAIKVSLQQNDPVDTLIFDEVDSGISGSTAQQLGKVIQNLSQFHQIIVITHLPQIASCGRSHFRIKKITDEGRTRSEMIKLTAAERRQEIAGLISGTKVTESSISQAEQLILESNG